MNDAERTATAAAIRRTSKGPADAVIRQATDAEVDAAFNDPSGERGAPDLPGAHKIGGAGGKGSVAGIRTGSKEAGGGLDVRAAENLRIRAQRRAAQQGSPPAGTTRPPAAAPLQAPPGAALEDWEVLPETPAPAPQPVAQARPAAEPRKDYYADFPPGDRLAVAQMDALAILGHLPEGFELFVGGDSMAPEGVALVMGIGLLIGKGYAVYRGDNHYRLSAEGREAYKRGEHGHA